MNPKPELRPFYEAESPDELALVDAAFAYNFKLMKRSPSSVTVSLPGEGKVEFQVLHVLPFDSVRKRMSVILKDPNTGEIKLYCKVMRTIYCKHLHGDTNKTSPKIGPRCVNETFFGSFGCVQN